MKNFEEERELYLYYLSKLKQKETINALDSLKHTEQVLTYLTTILGRLLTILDVFQREFKEDLSKQETHPVSESFKNFSLKFSELYKTMVELDTETKKHLLEKIKNEIH